MLAHATTEAAGEDLMIKDKTKMVEEPDMWRIDIEGHLPGADKSAKRAAQADLRTGTKSFEMHERIDGQETRSGNIALRRRHFTRHWRKWEHSNAPRASTEVGAAAVYGRRPPPPTRLPEPPPSRGQIALAASSATSPPAQ